MQHQTPNHQVLRRDQRRLAVRAEGEALAGAVGQRDAVGDRLEEVGQEREARGGLGGQELEDLWDLDDGGEGDDADAEGLGEGEAEAGRGGRDIEEEGLVAFAAEQGVAGGYEGSGEVGG